MLDKEELKKELRKEFPGEAKQKKEFGGFKAAGYSPAYITERLNDVFGYDGWEAKLEPFTITKGGEAKSVEVLLTEKSAIVQVRLSTGDCLVDPGDPAKFRERQMVRYQFGTCNITEKGLTPGEAIKGAFTDALKKCAAYLDIGNDAYKGEVEVGFTRPTSQRGSEKKRTREPDKRKEEKKEEEKNEPPGGFEELLAKSEAIIKRLGLSVEEVDKIAVECGAEDFGSVGVDELEKIVPKLSQLWNERNKEKKEKADAKGET